MRWCLLILGMGSAAKDSNRGAFEYTGAAPLGDRRGIKKGSAWDRYISGIYTDICILSVLVSHGYRYRCVIGIGICTRTSLTIVVSKTISWYRYRYRYIIGMAIGISSVWVWGAVQPPIYPWIHPSTHPSIHLYHRYHHHHHHHRIIAISTAPVRPPARPPTRPVNSRASWPSWGEPLSLLGLRNAQQRSVTSCHLSRCGGIAGGCTALAGPSRPPRDTFEGGQPFKVENHPNHDPVVSLPCLSTLHYARDTNATPMPEPMRRYEDTHTDTPNIYM